MTPADGGAAFPSVCLGDPGHPSSLPGMSLRDWFAGQALAGMMANANIPFSADYAECEPAQIASAIYDIADASIAERAARQDRPA